jgi:hypothetical protein
MEFIQEYKKVNIYKSKGFFKTGYYGADISNINLLKKLIDIKTKKQNKLWKN